MQACKCIALITFFSCCVFFSNTSAQELPHFIENLTTKEGLSSNKINDLAQDDNGFLWIATTDGLNRFDGTEVQQYFHKDNANSLSHNYVYCVESLPGNYIAVGTQAGIDFYNSNTGVFTPFYYKQHTALDEYSNIITIMQTDAMGNLWAASSNYVFIFDKSRRLKKLIPSSFTEADITRKRLKFVDKMFPLSNGDMLLYLSTGLKIYSHLTNDVVDIEHSSSFGSLKFLYDLYHLPPSAGFDEYTPAANVFKLFDKYFLVLRPHVDSLFLLDEEGHAVQQTYFPYNKYPYILWSQRLATIDSSRLLFLFHNYGLADLSITWENNHPVIHSPSPLLFDNYEYDGALRDRQNNWWLATTNEGLQKISPAKQYFKSDTLIDQQTGRPIKYNINSITSYHNTLWVSTYGNGFFEVDQSTGTKTQHFIITSPGDRWPNFVWNIRQITDDSLWVGTQAGLFWYCTTNHRYGRIQNFPGKPSCLDSVAITTQFVDSHRKVWMGLGKSHGVCCFDIRNRRFEWFPSDPRKGYPLRYPTATAEDSKGDLWFVNDASGVLIHYKRTAGKFETITLESEMHKRLKNLSGIWIADDSTFWMGTVTDGLVRYNVNTGRVVMYGHEKGLLTNHITNIFPDRKDSLWLITEGDLSCFDRRSETFTSYAEKDGLPVSYPTALFLL